jgi:hypothetical protein
MFLIPPALNLVIAVARIKRAVLVSRRRATHAAATSSTAVVKLVLIAALAAQHIRCAAQASQRKGTPALATSVTQVLSSEVAPEGWIDFSSK